MRGISRMIEEDRYCIDVLTQVQAVRAALGKVEGEILKDHADTCVKDAIASGDETRRSEKLAELVDLFGKFSR